jgi:subtilisin family serine protease
MRIEGMNDPYFNQQWHLKNTGQIINGVGGTIGEDVNVVSAWNCFGVSGKGVQIGIVDSGLDIAHTDLQHYLGNGIDSWDFTPPLNSNPSALPNYVDAAGDDSENSHGTSCAGVAAASGNNAIGGTGVFLHFILSCSLYLQKYIFYLEYKA